MQAAFDHVHLYASDPQATIAFYAEHFGAEVVGELKNSAGGVNHLLLLGGQLVAVSAPPLGPGKPAAAPESRLGLAHIGLNVPDLDEALASCRRAGIEILAPAKRAGLLGYAYIAGPDGVVIELTAYHLPRALRPLLPAAQAWRGLVNAGRRTVLRAALR